MSESLTFRKVDGGAEVGDSSLDAWYSQIRETPISEFGDGDLARACRQKLFLEHVVPSVVFRLVENPLAGDLYDGELLSSLLATANGFSPKSVTDTRRLCDSLKRVDLANCDEDSRRFVIEALDRFCHD